MSVVTHYWEDGKFKVKHKPVRRDLYSWRDEHLEVARLVAERTNKPLYVLLSGGVDGEIVARDFLKLGIPFAAISVKHKQNTNSYDMEFAEAFCKEYGIEHKLVELDIEQFFTDGFEKYVEQGYRSTNLFFYQQLFLFEEIEKLGGFGVSGEGDQSYCTVNGEICIKFNPSFMILQEWCNNNNTKHELAFNRSTPELFASWMKIDLIDYLLQKPEYFMNHYYDSTEKILVYHRYWPIMRRRNKSSGFEQIEKKLRFPKEHELKIRFQDIKDIYVPVKTIKNELGI
jgi:hypothetical protein